MESITGLFNQLLNAHVSNELLRPQLDPHNTTLNKRRKVLRAVLYRTLFAHLTGPLQQDTVSGFGEDCHDCGDYTGTKERLLQVVFDLRRLRKFDEAHKLDTLISSIPDLDNGQCPDLKAVIQLLLVLAGTGRNHHEKPPVGHKEPYLPLVASDNKDDRTVLLPTGPRYHGDSRHVYQQGYQGYIHYSRDLFEGKKIDVAQEPLNEGEFGYYRIIHNKIFEVEPGKDLLGNGLFSLKGLLDDQYEHTMRETLFGGLTHSKTRQLNVKLDFPELPDTTNVELLGLRVPDMSEPSEDEGFHETSSVSTPQSETPAVRDDNVWQRALDYHPNRHYTWETIGNVPRATERPYLTEAGREVFDEMYRQRCHEASLLDASLQCDIEVLPDQTQLVRDSIHVLLSVPSVTFQFNKDTQCFTINPDIRLSGTTPGSFNQLLAELAQAGTDHYRLTLFAQQRALDSMYTGGLVLQAFTSGIRKFLQYYQAVLQRAPSSDDKLTVMTVRVIFGKMMQQLRYLSALCGCDHPVTTKPGDVGNSFPLGIKLLSYLYEEALDCSLQDRYQLVLSLLRSSCGPYLMFIQDWVFHGISRDVFGEFLISVSDEYLHYRDKHYWTHGFVLKSDNTEESVPSFLKDLAYDMYVCGKSLNLMRLCYPEHFICNPEVTTPRINLTFSTEELDNSARKTRVYIKHMRALARQKTITRKEQELLESEAKQGLIVQARKAAAEDLRRLQDEIQEQRVAEDAKKRLEFKSLKDQMQRDIVRRALAEETEHQEDSDRMDAVTKREGEEANAQYKLEQKVREEVITHYARLSEEADSRERRALWRVRRHQLDQARLEFVVREESKIQQELAEKQARYVAWTVDWSSVSVTSEVMERSNGTVTTMERQEKGKMGKDSAQGTIESIDKSDGRNSNLPLQGSEMPISQVESQQGLKVERNLEAQTIQQKDILPGRASTNLLISVESTSLGTGDVPNEDIDETLRLIGQQSSGSGQTTNQKGRTITPPNLMDFSIQDFLPKENIEDDGLEKASLEADVDDVLIQIGSNLAAEEQKVEVSSSTDVTKELLGLPESESAIKTVALKAPPSNSTRNSLKIPATTVEQSTLASHSTIGHSIGSESRGGQDSLGGEIKEIAKTSIGHPGDSVLGDILYPSHKGTQPDDAINPQSTDTTVSNIPPVSMEHSIPSVSVTYGKPSYSSSEGGQLNQLGEENIPKPKSVYGHAGDSSLGDVLYPGSVPKVMSAEMHQVNDIVKTYNKSTDVKQDVGATQKVSKVGSMPFKPPIGHASDSTIQSMLYPDDGQITDIQRLPGVTHVAMPHGHHPSDSTAQNFMYGDQRIEQTDSQISSNIDGVNIKEDQTAIVWSGQGVEPFQDNFDALSKPPMPDLLSSIGYMPLSTEIGDYGLQAAESESTDAVELQSLPVIMKRAVTAPLLAQITLVNQSILDYFMVDLGIGKHFQALRSFLFLEDGEFGQSMCDQLFDKVAQGIWPSQLLTPIVLNQLLARAVQNSASRESEYADNLGFSLKYLPHHFKPNAIGTFDCLELRYRVEWPCNIVITDTCLTKYNRVFSFLLQLKRISWVLRDIYFQLKRSALVTHAGNSSQFRQLQLFRHEMQHFVNVIQGYVVNQVIHVTWEEFQRQLKTEVQNLDDLHQKHAEYLNKAVFRCLLNKKAAPVMKIISDILCLILKVRTQLLSTAWTYDKDRQQAIHPGFNTIKTSYLAFKDYSEFLYKVVAKLVTRGYQPHLEEFMLRLNFNDFYQDS